MKKFSSCILLVLSIILTAAALIILAVGIGYSVYGLFSVSRILAELGNDQHASGIDYLGVAFFGGELIFIALLGLPAAVLAALTAGGASSKILKRLSGIALVGFGILIGAGFLYSLLFWY